MLDVKHLNSMRLSLRILHLGCHATTSAHSSMKFRELRYLGVWDHSNLPIKVEGLDMLGMYIGPLEGITLNNLTKSLSMMVIAERHKADRIILSKS